MKKLLSIFCLLATACGATTLDFTYSGDRYVEGLPGQQSIEDSGSGYGVMTFASGLTTVSLSDVTSFYFDVSTTYYWQSPVTTLVSDYGLSDLTSLSLVLGPGNIPVSGGFSGEDFTIQTNDGYPYGQIWFDITGPVTFTDPPDAPEPLTIGLLGSGFVLLFFWKRHRA